MHYVRVQSHPHKTSRALLHELKTSSIIYSLNPTRYANNDP